MRNHSKPIIDGEDEETAGANGGKKREASLKFSQGNQDRHDEHSAASSSTGGCPVGQSPLLFSCRCESAKAVTTLLSCLRHFSASSGGSGVGEGNAVASNHTSRGRCLSLSAVTDDATGRGRGSRGALRAQHATVYVSSSALNFHVHGLARQSQASVDMQSGLFSNFYVAEDEIVDERTGEKELARGGEFCVNLTTVLECLHVLGTANLERTKVCLSYDRSTAIFKIELEERGVLCTCAIAGSVPADDGDEFHYDDDDNEEGGGNAEGATSSSLAVAFRRDPVVARAIIKSDYLRDAIAELADIGGATCCTIGIAPNRIELGTVGHSGECLVDLPKSPDVFLSLDCNPPILHARSYPLNSLLQGMRGLDIANETCVSINERGMIAIQHQVLDMVGSGQPNFIDFLMGAILDDDEDEDDSRGDLKSSAKSQESDNYVAGFSDENEGGENYNEDDSGSTTGTDDSQTKIRSSQKKTQLNVTNTQSRGEGLMRSPPRSSKQEEPLYAKGNDEDGVQERPSQLRRLDDGSESPELLFGGTRILPTQLTGIDTLKTRRRSRHFSEEETSEEEFH